MNSIRDKNFQLGLLHLVYLLVNIDAANDERARNILAGVRDKEQISEAVFRDFKKAIANASKTEIYRRGLYRLNQCDEEVKRAASIYLYQILDAEQKINVKEIRFVLYSLKALKIDFDDVVWGVNVTAVASRNDYATQFKSAIFNASEIIPSPSSICSSVTVSGGATKI